MKQVICFSDLVNRSLKNYFMCIELTILLQKKFHPNVHATGTKVEQPFHYYLTPLAKSAHKKELVRTTHIAHSVCGISDKISLQSQYIHLDSILLATIQLWYIQFLPGWSRQKSSVRVFDMNKQPLNQFSEAVRAYCSNRYIVRLSFLKIS